MFLLLESAWHHAPDYSGSEGRAENEGMPADEAEQLRRELTQWSAFCPDLAVPGKIDSLVAEFKAKKEAEERGGG